MNYLTELNAFHEQLNNRPLGGNAILLWHGLMHVANRSGWKEWITVPVSTLMSQTGLSQQGVYRARKELKQKGLVTWKARGGKLSVAYRLTPFAEQRPDRPADRPADKLADKPADRQTDNISKPNETKPNQTGVGAGAYVLTQEENDEFCRELFGGMA